MDPVSKVQLEVVPKNRRRHQIDPEVGKATQFKPGESGNLRGRPRKGAITKIFEEILAKAKNREDIKKALLNTLTSKGMAGVLLLREAAERTEGKVTQEIELNVLQTMSDQELEQRLEIVKNARSA